MEYITSDSTKLKTTLAELQIGIEDYGRVYRLLSSKIDASIKQLNNQLKCTLQNIDKNIKQRDAILTELAGRNCLELNNGDIYYIDFDIITGELFAGGATNSGITKQYAIKYDFDADIYANIEALMNAHDLY